MELFSTQKYNTRKDSFPLLSLSIMLNSWRISSSVIPSAPTFHITFNFSSNILQHEPPVCFLFKYHMATSSVTWVLRFYRINAIKFTRVIKNTFLKWSFWYFCFSHPFSFRPAIPCHLNHHQLDQGRCQKTRLVLRVMNSQKQNASYLFTLLLQILTLNSSKSTLRSPLLSRLLKIFSMFSSDMSLVILLRKRMISPKERLLLPSVSICLNMSRNSFSLNSRSSMAGVRPKSESAFQLYRLSFAAPPVIRPWSAIQWFKKISLKFPNKRRIRFLPNFCSLIFLTICKNDSGVEVS